MRKPTLALVAMLAATAMAAASPADARPLGRGAGIVGGLIAGAIVAGIASNAYRQPVYNSYGYYPAEPVYPAYPVYESGYSAPYYGGYVPPRGYGVGDNMMDRYPNP